MIGKTIKKLDTVDSTNLYLVDILESDRPKEGLVVITENQTQGRGLDGNSWQSAPALNLTFSFVLYPHFLEPGAQFYLNKLISLGLTDTARECIPDRNDIRVKWPNDIYIGDKKLAGTLIQNGIKGDKFDYSIIGIGLNVNQVSFPKSAGTPVSLKSVAGREFELEKVLNLLLKNLNRRYKQLQNGMFREIDEDYLQSLYRLNDPAAYDYKEETIMAEITGVNEYGQLILEISGGETIECNLKEIKFIL